MTEETKADAARSERLAKQREKASARLARIDTEARRLRNLAWPNWLEARRGLRKVAETAEKMGKPEVSKLISSASFDLERLIDNLVPATESSEDAEAEPS